MNLNSMIRLPEAAHVAFHLPAIGPDSSASDGDGGFFCAAAVTGAARGTWASDAVCDVEPHPAPMAMPNPKTASVRRSGKQP